MEFGFLCENPTPLTHEHSVAKGSMAFTCVSQTKTPPNLWKKQTVSTIIFPGTHVKSVTCAGQWRSNTLLFRKTIHYQWWRQVSRCKKPQAYSNPPPLCKLPGSHILVQRISTVMIHDPNPSTLADSQNSEASLESWITQRMTHLIKMTMALKTIWMIGIAAIKKGFNKLKIQPPPS